MRIFIEAVRRSIPGKVTAVERGGCIDRLRHAWRKLHDFARFPRVKPCMYRQYRLEDARAKSTHLDITIIITYKNYWKYVIYTKIVSI